MYRILVLFAILNIYDCHWCNRKPHCQLKNNHFHDHKYHRGFGHNPPSTETPKFVPGNTFEEIASNVIKIENALKKFCDENNINRASEIYGEDNYILKYRLPEFDETNIDIKIMNRVIYTTADRKDGTVKTFKDLRILPDVVRANEAKWVYEHKTVKIFVPYKVPLRNEAVKDCGAVDDSVKNVPQMGSPGLEFRSGPGIPVNGSWGLPAFICDVYIAMDVTSSTSSIFNLVAISVDRYIAVTQPIKYAKHKNNRRVWFTIVLVWMVSAAIGAPIVLGLNDTPDRNYDECLFNSQNYVLYSSLGSFYIPCIMMMFLYYNIFKALRNRAKKQRAAKQPPVSGEPATATAAVVIENVAQTRQLETALDDRPTNTGSGSNEDDHDDSFDKRSVELEADADDCHVIPNNKSTEFMLATVKEETVKTPKKTFKSQCPDPNGNNDSGYAPSNLEYTIREHTSPPASPGLKDATVLKNISCDSKWKKNGKRMDSDSRTASIAFRSDDDLGTSQYDIRDGSSSKKERKASAATARFTIYKANKASKKKREKSSAKKERKATKTLAIVLGVFLFCWTPFFTCNVLDAICAKFGLQFSPGVTVFILNTWLGYINSFLNPVIYTIFNPEFRKAFRKILKCGT